MTSRSDQKDGCKWTYEELKQICKYEHISCSGTKEELCERLTKHIAKLGENKSAAKSGVYAPEKYFEGLTPKEREKRLQEIRKGSKSDHTEKNSYKPFSTDFEKKDGKKVRRKTKRSTYTQAFYDMYPNADTLEKKSEVTGVPVDILKKVWDKGIAAWRTGHRPGATQAQWAGARVNSFLMKGCTYYFPDHTLVEDAKKRSSKAKEHWSNVECICKKGCSYETNKPKRK